MSNSTRASSDEIEIALLAYARAVRNFSTAPHCGYGSTRAEYATRDRAMVAKSRALAEIERIAEALLVASEMSAVSA